MNEENKVPSTDTQNGHQKSDLIYKLAQESEALIYQYMHETPPFQDILHQSSKELFVYKSLEAILRPKGRKGDVLRIPPFRDALQLWCFNESCFDIAEQFKCHGNDLMIQVATLKPHFENRSLHNEMNRETEMVIRTTALYPLRGNKCHTMCNRFRTQMTRHCLSIFIPKVYLHSQGLENLYERKPEEQWQIYSLCLNSSIQTVNPYTPEDVFYRILRGKLNCPFDIVLEQRLRQERPWMMDTLILSDLYCRKVEEVDLYVKALNELLLTYRYHFRHVIVCAPDNPELLSRFNEESWTTVSQEYLTKPEDVPAVDTHLEPDACKHTPP